LGGFIALAVLVIFGFRRLQFRSSNPWHNVEVDPRNADLSDVEAIEGQVGDERLKYPAEQSQVGGRVGGYQ
jgi:hypothetical protein